MYIYTYIYIYLEIYEHFYFKFNFVFINNSHDGKLILDSSRSPEQVFTIN